MEKSICTYDVPSAKSANLDRILQHFKGYGVKDIYIKKLSPNDNSKNQAYFGSHLSDLAFIPTGNITASKSRSEKRDLKDGSNRKIKYQADIDFSWMDSDGKLYSAPNAKLIYYPQYPEVRFSGFLHGSSVNLSRWMDPKKEGRSEGRWLILGILNDSIYAYLVTPESYMSEELQHVPLIEITSVFSVLGTSSIELRSNKIYLLRELNRISNLGWIPSQKLNKSGEKVLYQARNGAGYTLEAELGIYPNGRAGPDYLGWELKQFGVKEFPTKGVQATTLMTPSPDGGIYKDNGTVEFVKFYGYKDKSGKPDRMNFGGIHKVGKLCTSTSLRMAILGFDYDSLSITDAEGKVALIDQEDNIAASWSFPKLVDHWKKKHSQAAYIPSMKRISDLGMTEYRYGKDIQLGEGTNFELLLRAMVNNTVYYDPGIKVENLSRVKPDAKDRSQFRIKHQNIPNLYDKFEYIDLEKFLKN